MSITPNGWIMLLIVARTDQITLQALEGTPGCNILKLMGLGSDGASCLMRKRTGAATLLGEDNPCFAAVPLAGETDKILSEVIRGW